VLDAYEDNAHAGRHVSVICVKCCQKMLPTDTVCWLEPNTAVVATAVVATAVVHNSAVVQLGPRNSLLVLWLTITSHLVLICPSCCCCCHLYAAWLLNLPHWCCCRCSAPCQLPRSFVNLGTLRIACTPHTQTHAAGVTASKPPQAAAAGRDGLCSSNIQVLQQQLPHILQQVRAMLNVGWSSWFLSTSRVPDTAIS
jgi:hypothetical protein